MSPALPWLRLRWRAEAAVVRALFRLLRALGPRRASDLGGLIGRFLGPFLPVSRVARVNLRLAFPDRDAAWRAGVVRAMWDNLGRTAAELACLEAIVADPAAVEVEGVEHFDAAARAGGPWILVSGHFANWEIELPMAARRGVIPGVVYRAIANPHLDALIAAIRTRAMGQRAVMLPKGPAGARATLTHLKTGGVVGMLVDQKMNDGIEARLFGRPAMTAPAAAHLALRFRCPLIPARAIRLGPARFRLEVLPPIPLPEAEDRHAAVAALTQRLNDLIEAWARERPAEWLWVHRRFDKAVYARGP